MWICSPAPFRVVHFHWPTNLAWARDPHPPMEMHHTSCSHQGIDFRFPGRQCTTGACTVKFCAVCQVAWEVYARDIRAVYTRENKPRITQSAAYLSRELSHLYEHGLYKKLVRGLRKPRTSFLCRLYEQFAAYISRGLCNPRLISDFIVSYPERTNKSTRDKE